MRSKLVRRAGLLVTTVALLLTLQGGPGAVAGAQQGPFTDGGVTVTITGDPVYFKGDVGPCSDPGFLTSPAHLSNALTFTITWPFIPQRLVLTVGANGGYANSTILTMVPGTPVLVTVPAGGMGFTCKDLSSGSLPFTLSTFEFTGFSLVGTITLTNVD